jgi:hypothetical protein
MNAKFSFDENGCLKLLKCFFEKLLFLDVDIKGSLFVLLKSFKSSKFFLTLFS